MMTINDTRNDILTDARAKREAALRVARTGTVSEQEFWLDVAGRMTIWIEHLEHNGTRVARWPPHIGERGTPIDLPPHARPARSPAPAPSAE